MTTDEITARIEAIEQRLDRIEKRRKPTVKMEPHEQTAAERVIASLNKKAGTSFRAEGESVRLIVCRLREGYAVEDLLKVVWHKVGDWRSTEMAKWLRPSTLFAPKKIGERVDEARAAYDAAQKRRTA